MKKKTMRLLSVLLALLLLPAALPAAAEQEGDILYAVYNNEAIITGVSGEFSGALTIPASLGGCPVVRIAQEAFKNNQAITAVTLPATLVRIGDSAFYNCDSLEFVNFSACTALASIGGYAFHHCDTFAAADFTGCTALASIGSYAFSYSSLAAVDFTGCTALANIGDDAFYRCSALAAVDFTGCTALESIGGEAFLYCYALAAADFTGCTALESIGSAAFYSCYALAAADFTGCTALASIGSAAFYSCSALAAVDFTGCTALASIGYEAFCNCRALAAIALPASVTAVCADSFAGTAFYNNGSSWDTGVLYLGDILLAAKKDVISGEYTVRQGTRVIASSAFSGYAGLTAVQLPEGLTHINSSAFYNCGDLAAVVLPASLAVLSAYAFASCSKLTSVTVQSRTCSFGDSPFNGTVTTLYAYPGSTAEAYAKSRSNLTFVALEDTHEHAAMAVAAVAPTCTRTGKTAGSICSICGTILTAQASVPALGHNYTVQSAEATCTTGGFVTYACTRCGDTQTTTVASLGHNYATVVTAPTCTLDGFTTYTCTRCAGSYTADPVPSPGHSAVLLPAVAPTCVLPGKTEGSACGTCGEVLTAQTELAALQHSYTAVVTAPTCTLDGFTTHTCTRCGDTYTEAIPTSGHTAEALLSLEATCTTAGIANGSWCTVCGRILHAPELVAALGHDYAEEIVPATCILSGSVTKTCTRCGVVSVQSIAPLEHTYEAVVTAPTGTLDGFTTYTCTLCGDSYTADPLPAAHTPEALPSVAPTCTTAGKQGGTRCAVCGQTLTSAVRVPALGHDYEAVIGDKTKTYTCTHCGDSYTEEISVLDQWMQNSEFIRKIFDIFRRLLGNLLPAETV